MGNIPQNELMLFLFLLAFIVLVVFWAERQED